MPITKNDIRKQLEFDGEDVSPADPSRRGSRSKAGNQAGPTQGTEQQSRSTRSRVQQGGRNPQKNSVNLQNMNSAEFMALIGEGPSAPAITTTKNLKASIKNDDALKMKMMISLNDNVLRADGVAVSAEKSNVGEQDNIASETPGDNPAVASVAEKPVDEPLNIEKKADEHAPKIMSENETDTDKSVLDVTVPLHAEVESQTDTSYILCTCSSCKGLVSNFSKYLTRGYGDNCVQKHETSARGSNNESNGNNHLTFYTSHEGDDEKIPLYKGCLVRISVTARAKLRALDRDSNAQPKDYVYAIMDDIFTPEVMANMTAKGKTKGSTQIDAKILDCLLVYLQNKFDNIKSVIDIVNTKCYCERRKLWGKNTETVRKPLPKNSKKQTDDMGKDKKDMDQDKRKKKNKGTSSKRSEKKKDGKYRHMTDSASETVKQFRKSKCWNSPLKPSNNRQLKPTKSRSKKNLKEAGAFKPKPRPQFGGKRPKLLDEILRHNAHSDEDTDDGPARKRRHNDINYDNEFANNYYMKSSTPSVKLSHGAKKSLDEEQRDDPESEAADTEDSEEDSASNDSEDRSSDIDDESGK